MNVPAANSQLSSGEMEPSERCVHVQVTNRTGVSMDGSRMELAVRAALADRAGESEVSVAIVDDATIHRLNRQFLEHDYPTDVLSFALVDEPGLLEGEIIVSVETAEREAISAGWSTADELLLYVVHGALHLAGHGDKNAGAAAAMHTAEAAILDLLGVVRSSRDSRWSEVTAPRFSTEEPAL